ncbi:diguanylate cyclase [Catenovulum adriaticum]|uniref:diguanylate cyclase n=1 Tax=Catenovulum adriaticum TaxID=2984846 RepID=A0ABY7AQI0_9ALTE|nr:diguanylate cyclase [Catenovulum sp. TS8]WAJ70511.1 diguanylate cyclase [Catenovulum sp. TS8]
MNNTILIVNDNAAIAARVRAIANKLGFESIHVASYFQLEKVLSVETHFFCACVDFSLPDAKSGEAIDFLISQNIPSFVLTNQLADTTRDAVLSKAVVDYIAAETIHSFDYIAKLLLRLKHNRDIRILIVDDALSARNYLKKLLLRHNFKVSEASDGAEALALLENQPDIKMVVTDQTMPNMTGIELVQKIRMQYSLEQLAIIAISATPKSIIAARFLKNGANDCLSKPFNPDEFYARIFCNLEYIEHVAEVQFAANHDYLTRLFNRRYFFERAGEITQHDNISNSALAIIDLDHFKQINDQYGHDAGDSVLRQTAQRLESHFRGNLVARFGGEEFCILLQQMSPDEALGRLEFFIHHLEHFEMEIPNNSISITASVGFTVCQSNELEKLIKQADIALYQAKNNGRNQVVEFKG